MDENEYITLDGLSARLAIHERCTVGTDNLDATLIAFALSEDPTTLLDIGCGTGQFLETISKQRGGISLHGIDLSPSAVQSTCRRGIKATEGDAQHIPFPDDSFSAVVAKHMIYHVDNPRKALLEMRRVARPGGTLSISVNNTNSLPRIQETLLRAITLAGATPRQSNNWIDGDTLGQLMTSEFGDCQTVSAQSLLRLQSATDLFTYCDASLNMYLSEQEARSELRESIRHFLSELCESEFRNRRYGWFDVKGWTICHKKLP